MALWPRNTWLLSLCGALLILSQYVVVREFGSSFYSTEIITVVATIMIMLGPSLAYCFSDKISDRTLAILGGITFFVLLSCPISIRALVAYLSALNLEWVAFAIVFISGSLFCSAFFAFFLPRLCSDGESFRKLYAIELAGAIGGLLIIGVSLNFSWQVLISIFWLLIVLVLHLVLKRKWLSFLCLIAVAGSTYFYPQLDQQVMSKYLESYWNVKNAQVLETRYSPFQRIDIVQEPEGRAIYLDGVPYYQSGDLHWFNYYISALPGTLLQRKGEALVIGSGSLISTAHLIKQGYSVTTIDIDKNVAELGLKYFSDKNSLNENTPGFKLVIDDARAYVHNLNDKKFDLIIMDTPAPYHLQTSMLYTKNFFADLKNHLKPGGIASINTCAWDLDEPIGASIARGASEVFPEIYTVQGESVGLTIMYCSDHLNFDSKKLKQELLKTQEYKFTIYDRPVLETFLSNVKAHGIKNPIALLTLSRIHLPKLKSQ